MATTFCPTSACSWPSCARVPEDCADRAGPMGQPGDDDRISVVTGPIQYGRGMLTRFRIPRLNGHAEWCIQPAQVCVHRNWRRWQSVYAAMLIVIACG